MASYLRIRASCFRRTSKILLDYREVGVDAARIFAPFFITLYTLQLLNGQTNLLMISDSCKYMNDNEVHEAHSKNTGIQVVRL